MSKTIHGFKNLVFDDSRDGLLVKDQPFLRGGVGGDCRNDLSIWKEKDLLGANGKPRIWWARESFKNDDLDEESRVLLVKLFKEWCFYDEYLVLQRRRVWDWKIMENVAVKCSKRGNDVYRWRLKRRLFGVNDILEKYGDLRVLDRYNRSRVLCFTLTYDVNRCSVKDAWMNIGRDYNRFISAVKKKYGKVQCLRVFESTSKGYPHIHVLMVFEESQFHTYRHQSKNGQIDLRIEEKGEFEGYHHSYIDVFSPYNLGSGIKYFIKYLGKVHRNPRYINDGGEDLSKFDLTLAMMWIFRKRSFSISRDLQHQLSDLICYLRNSNFSGVGQVDLEGESIYEWVFLGVYSGSDIGIDDSSWSVRLKDLRFINDY